MIIGTMGMQGRLDSHLATDHFNIFNYKKYSTKNLTAINIGVKFMTQEVKGARFNAKCYPNS